MLRCPKCSRIYQKGSQRFCPQDGGRLLSITETSGAFGQSFGAGDRDGSQNFGFKTAKSSDAFGFAGKPQPAAPETQKNGQPQLVARQSAPAPVAVLPPSDSDQRIVAATAKIEEAPDSLGQTAANLTPIKQAVTDATAEKQGIEPVGDATESSVVKAAATGSLATSDAEILLGKTIKNRYVLERIIAQNASSVVFFGRDRDDDRLVWVKVLLDPETLDAEFKERFLTEKAALGNLVHPCAAEVLDAGELAAGNLFVVSEHLEGSSPLRAAMKKTGQFGTARAARIVRQIAQALSESHNNRLLHRNLKPENVILTRDEKGEETVKVINFGLGERHSSDLPYHAPEFFERSSGGSDASEPRLTPESDIFSLGAIAFEMLTGRLPFAGAKPEDLLEAMRRELAINPSNLRLDLPLAVDPVLQRALAFNRAQRFHHAREFGETLFGALTETAARAPAPQPISPIVEALPAAAAVLPPAPENAEAAAESDDLLNADATSTAEIAAPEKESFKSVGETKPEIAPVAVGAAKLRGRSPKRGLNLPLAAALLVGALLLAATVLTSRSYFTGGNSAAVNDQNAAPVESAALAPQAQNQNSAPSPTSVNVAPPTTNSIAFQNTKENLKGKLADNYVYFSLSYPRLWQQNQKHADANNFLDVSNKLSSGTPLEQLLVSWYESKGTFAADLPNFPRLSRQVARKYAYDKRTGEGIPELRKVSEGEIKLNGRDAYEVKFEGEALGENNETIQIWGRTIFLPTGQPNARSGLLLTMLATSLAPDLKNVNDVGVKGQLPGILESFAPDSAAGS